MGEPTFRSPGTALLMVTVYIHTGTVPTLGYPGAASLHTIPSHRDLLLGRYPVAALSQGIHTYTHGILVQFLCRYGILVQLHCRHGVIVQLRCRHGILVQLHCRHGILVQLHCRLYKNTGTYPWVSCSSSAAGYTYSPRYLYSGTLVQLCCRLSSYTGT